MKNAVEQSPRRCSVYFAAGFIRPIKYSKWLANPVLVEKKNGTWRMCIDYTN